MKKLTITPGAAAFSAILLILVLIVGAGNLYATYQITGQYNRAWCVFLSTLKLPPHPTASQVQSWSRLVALEHEIGCEK